MIDIHCHILPYVDDGAETMDDALEMARLAASGGVTVMIATPHCNLPGTEFDNYVSAALRDRFVALGIAIHQAGIPLTILPGAEVFCTPELPILLAQKKFQPLAGSRYLLLEFPFDEAPSRMEAAFSAVSARGFVPVAAHPERYDAIQEDPEIVECWFRSGTVIQLNKGSILGSLGRRAERTSHWLLNCGLAHIVASDGHDPQIRTPHMQQLQHLLVQNYGPEYAGILLQHNPERIVRNLPMVSP